MSHVSGKVGLLYHMYLWYSPNIQAKFENPSPSCASNQEE